MTDNSNDDEDYELLRIGHDEIPDDYPPPLMMTKN